MRNTFILVLWAIFLGLLLTHKCEASPAKDNKNKLKVYGGAGPGDLKKISSNKIVQENEVLNGFGYERKIDNDFSVEVLYINNGSYLLGIGLSF